jgi:hypothetical protein
VEQERVEKRVAQPFGKQFEEAFLHVARQFSSFEELSEPFTPTLTHQNKRAEIARQERLQKSFEMGTLTLRQYLRRTGSEDIAAEDDRFVVTVEGQEINYADHPKWVVRRLFSAAGATDPDQGGGDGGGGGEQVVENFMPAGGEPQTNGGVD